jgi:hypothetical protein
MSSRFGRISAIFLAASLCASVSGCAAHGSDDPGAPDAPDAGDDSESQAPSDFDSGGPATIGGDTHDSGSTPSVDSGTPPVDSGTVGGPCKTASDCPGAGKPNSSVACTSGKCTFECNGENYDVNGDPTDGCEVPDICPSVGGTAKCPVDNHTSALATAVGSFSCTDPDSAQNLDGLVPSDARDHAPAIDGFDATCGAAPDYFSIVGSGGVCQNDANLTLQMGTTAAQKGCYELHLLTDKNNGGQSCTTDLTGNCSITNGSGSYSDGSTLVVWVKKSDSCTAALFKDDAPFHISGHL